MNKAKFLIGTILASVAITAATALTACGVEDNASRPVDTIAVYNPAEMESDQPAYAPGQ